MKIAGIALACSVLVLLALPATAADGWTSYDSTGSYDDWAIVDGTPVYGTWSYRFSYEQRFDGTYYQDRGQAEYWFEAEDGTIHGHGINTSGQRSRAGSANTYTTRLHVNYFASDGGLVDQSGYFLHFTWNANGELTSIRIASDE